MTRPETAGRWHLGLNANALNLKSHPKLLARADTVSGGEIAQCLACARKGDRAFNIDPPTSSYAIKRRACPTAERTVDPARTVVESLTFKPGLENSIDPGCVKTQVVM